MMKESDIRPQALFNQYLQLAKDDIQEFFADTSAFESIDCPACESASTEFTFAKHGLDYRVCGECHSLFLSPRPSRDAIDHYYQGSAAVKFWETNFFKETAEARREKMFRPRAHLVAEWVRQLGLRGSCVDIGSGYGIFLEEMAKLAVFDEVLGVEPAPNLAAVCKERGFRVIQKPLERVKSGEVGAAFATAFEVLEHVYSPAEFLRAAGHLLRPEGVFLFTTPTVSGFDILELWENSKNVYPPHHINLLSVEGVCHLVEHCGFETLEVTTPGQLDVNIVENIVAENPDVPISRFARQLLRQPEGVKTAFQNFLQKNCLSSHLRVLVRKRI